MKALFLNQAFHPDVQATAQHASDLARALVGQGHSVSAVAGRHAYGRQGVVYPSYEERDGIQIHRVGVADLGKSARWRRAFNFASFLISCTWKLLWMPRHQTVIAMTSPPLITVLGALFTWLKGGSLIAWIMDLNPDEAVAAGWLPRRSIVTSVLDGLMSWSLKHSHCIIVLDRHMKQRVVQKAERSQFSLNGGEPAEVFEIPPGARGFQFDQVGRQQFRTRHSLHERFVVMYSGNHSPCHPLHTVLDAAERFKDDPSFVFLFVGGGSQQPKVRGFAQARGLSNVITLPYQPEESLPGTLSAADLHVVAMGDPFVGIVHPSKIYNVMQVGAPVLYVGPEESHITDMVAPTQAQRAQSGWFYEARHGEVDRVVAHIRRAQTRGTRNHPDELAIAEGFAHHRILQHLTGVVTGQITDDFVAEPRRHLVASA